MMGTASRQDASLRAVLTLGWLTLAASAGEPRRAAGPRRRGGRQPQGRGGVAGLPSRASLVLGPGFVRTTEGLGQTRGLQIQPPWEPGHEGAAVTWGAHTPREGRLRLGSGCFLSCVRVKCGPLIERDQPLRGRRRAHAWGPARRPLP